jgi:hypothetical protein
MTRVGRTSGRWRMVKLIARVKDLEQDYGPLDMIAPPELL